MKALNKIAIGFLFLAMSVSTVFAVRPVKSIYTGIPNDFDAIFVDWIQFDLNPDPAVTPGEGVAYWNIDDGTLNIGMPGGNVNLQVGQEMTIRVTNGLGVQIDNGVPVYISGASGNNIIVGLADADFATGVGFRTIAVATENITAGQKGYVTTEGMVRDFKTDGFSAEGAPLYLASGGGFTETPPSAPDVTVFCGIVTRKHADVGSIYVKIISIPNLNSLSDVQGSVADNDMLQWDAATSTWDNTQNPIAPDSGIFGYWSRNGTVLTAVNTGDDLIIGDITVKSTDDSNYIKISHDNSNSYFSTDDGAFVFLTDEGTNTNTNLEIKGKGTGEGRLAVYDEDDAEYLRVTCVGGTGRIETLGSSPGKLHLQYNAPANIECFANCGEGETKELKIFGRRTGDTRRSLELSCGVDAADTGSYNGVGNHLFHGTIKSNNGAQLGDGGVTDYTQVEADGTLEFNGTATVWEDLRFPVSTVNLGLINAPTQTPYKGGITLAFADTGVLNQEEDIYFTAQIPHSYKEGSDIDVHIHWTPEDNTAGNVYWTFSHSWSSIGGTFPAATEINVATACDTVTDKHQMDDLVTLDGTGKTISSILICRLTRHSSNALDTYDGKEPYLHEIDFHYEKDTVGSRTESAK